MSKYWQVEVLTTCALDYMTWDNHFTEGVEIVDGVNVRRFSVDQRRDVGEFDRLSAGLVSKGADATLVEQKEWMRSQGPISNDLLRYLELHREDYEAFIFFGYLYATTYFGLPLVKERAFLAPLAHDEWTIHFSLWDKLFLLPKGFIFQTDEELQFLRKRFPAASLRGPIAGIGIDHPSARDADPFRRRYNLPQPFLLYVGRVDQSKGCSELFEFFIRFRAETALPHKLVVIGWEAMPIPFHPDIVYLGFVSEDEKWSAMIACDWLVIPSVYESLSIVLLETWMAGRPALVNARCTVLAGHCRRAGAGLWYSSYEEWRAAIELPDASAKDRLGLQGRRYVKEHYTWERVELDYLSLCS
jgi:glycosyltransferase involved in cell wall biosynthesis